MADVLAVRDEYQAQSWALLIQECQASGLTNKEFCRQRGISEKSYYYWLKKLRTQLAEAAGPQLVQLAAGPEEPDSLDIRFRGAEFHVPGKADLDAVAALLRSIQSL